jgi:hypothetical protein
VDGNLLVPAPTPSGIAEVQPPAQPVYAATVAASAFSPESVSNSFDIGQTASKDREQGLALAERLLAKMEFIEGMVFEKELAQSNVNAGMEAGEQNPTTAHDLAFALAADQVSETDWLADGYLKPKGQAARRPGKAWSSGFGIEGELGQDGTDPTSLEEFFAKEAAKDSRR